MKEITLLTYMIYKISFDNNPKEYIGYTTKGPDGRLHQHIKNMQSGMDNHLYRAMRKYGLENICIEVLEVCESKQRAQEREKYYIKENNSFVGGYNMTRGGDGGNTFECMSGEKKLEWLRQRKFLSSGLNNGNCTGVTDEEIVFHACEVAKKDGYLTCGNYRKYAEETKEKFNLPLNIGPTFRFNKLGFEGLKIEVAKALNIDLKKLKYIKTEKHREKISKAGCSYCWVHNNKEFIRVRKENIETYINSGWVRGRGKLV